MSALENWGSDPTEAYQELMSRELRGEYFFVALTCREALKCSELVRAAAAGPSVLAADASYDVARLLATLARDVGIGPEEDPLLDGLRERIAAYPWPPPGNPLDDPWVFWD